jgi:hypothetical protein
MEKKKTLMLCLFKLCLSLEIFARCLTHASGTAVAHSECRVLRQTAYVGSYLSSYHVDGAQTVTGHGSLVKSAQEASPVRG